MTEEDTFNKLRRTPLDKVKRLISNLATTYDGKEWDNSVTELLHRNGWTLNQYNDEYIKNYKPK